MIIGASLIARSSVYVYDADFVRDLWIVRFLHVTALTILLYEYFLTFPDEVSYIWSRHFSFVKVAFLVNRYGAIICVALTAANILGIWHSTAAGFCKRIITFQSIYMLSTVAIVQIIMLLRCWVIWNRRKVILAILIAVFVVSTGVSIVIAFMGFHETPDSAYFFTDIIGTCASIIPPYIWTLFIPGFLAEVGVFFLTMITFREHCVRMNILRRSPIIRTLYRDTIIYFITMVFCNLFNIIVWRMESNSPRNMLSNCLAVVLINVVTQRLVIDLRKIDHKSHAASAFTTTRLEREIGRALGDMGYGNGSVEEGNTRRQTTEMARPFSPIVFEVVQSRRSGWSRPSGGGSVDDEEGARDHLGVVGDSVEDDNSGDIEMVIRTTCPVERTVPRYSHSRLCSDDGDRRSADWGEEGRCDAEEPGKEVAILVRSHT